MNKLFRGGFSLGEIVVVAAILLILGVLLYDVIYPPNQRETDKLMRKATAVCAAERFPIQDLKGKPVSAAQLAGTWSSEPSRSGRTVVAIKPLNNGFLKLEIASSTCVWRDDFKRIGLLNPEQGIILLDKPAIYGCGGGFQFLVTETNFDGTPVLIIPTLQTAIGKDTGKDTASIHKPNLFTTLTKQKSP